MDPVTDEQLAMLAPYLAGSRADQRGEVPMRCPMHEDTRRSASINLDKGAWCCHAGCGGGSVRQLIESRDTWVTVSNGYTNYTTEDLDVRKILVEEMPTANDVAYWRQRLLREPEAIRWLREERGLELGTARKAHLGFDGVRFKIPIYGPGLEIWNVRTYDPDAPPTRSKIWSVRGLGIPRLYPFRTLRRAERGRAVIICEGEWDTLLALQAGFLAVTRTGAAHVWDSDWNQHFRGLRVFLCHDRDRAGQKADRNIGRELATVAQEVRRCHLPFRVRPKHGKDLTDFCLKYRKYGTDAENIRDLLDESTEVI